ncbi:helix-turn-helix domain-containing protein [Paenibacillus phocaensis]|uniref:helix-turn-helix domain-containing protein n=1 Tax=Paenibacillus phocaensis TaxID=1776378 RepID=UPI000839C3A2|nr:helix-turn-helix domain-containing protein [Paenibacillus phocaensis]
MLEDYDDIVDIECMMGILAIGRNKAYELLRSGQIKSFKIGKSYRIPKQCINDYIWKKIEQKLK